MTKSGLLRALLRRPGLVPMVGAHDALSAKLIEAAGFPVVWSSSFAVSAAQRAVLGLLAVAGGQVVPSDVRPTTSVLTFFISDLG